MTNLSTDSDLQIENPWQDACRQVGPRQARMLPKKGYRKHMQRPKTSHKKRFQYKETNIYSNNIIMKVSSIAVFFTVAIRAFSVGASAVAGIADEKEVSIFLFVPSTLT